MDPNIKNRTLYLARTLQEAGHAPLSPSLSIWVPFPALCSQTKEALCSPSLPPSTERSKFTGVNTAAINMSVGLEWEPWHKVLLFCVWWISPGWEDPWKQTVGRLHPPPRKRGGGKWSRSLAVKQKKKRKKKKGRKKRTPPVHIGVNAALTQD